MSASQEVFAARLTTVLQKIDGAWALIRAERLSGGASQETYRLTVATDEGERLLALRRTPGGVVQTEKVAGHPGLAVEAKLMQAAHAAGVPEPQVHYVLTEVDGLGDGFLMSWVEGEALGARIARGDAYADLREHLAYDCGRILARIHRIEVEQASLAGALEQVQPQEFVEQTLERYRVLNTPQPMIEYTARWLFEHLPENPRRTLVHNDFRNGNFMVSATQIVAVLDWELAHIGDPMRDLGWICTNSWRFGVGDKPVGGFGTYEDLFRGYQEESGQVVDAAHVKFWEVFGSFWWAVGCLGMAEHYRTGPDPSVERPAIGRRSSECQVDCVNLLIPGRTELLRPESAVAATAEVGPADAVIELPRADELLHSVRVFLHEEVMAATTGRLSFLARVAGNSLAIVERELVAGPALYAGEKRRLQALLGCAIDDLSHARCAVIQLLLDGRLALDDERLVDYLRFAVINQAGIDQPKYSGYRRALEYAGAIRPDL